MGQDLWRIVEMGGSVSWYIHRGMALQFVADY